MGLLFWLVIAPLIAALIILLMPRMSQAGYKTIAFLGVAASLVMTLVTWGGFDYSNHGFQFLSSTDWFTLPNLWAGKDLHVQLAFGVDGLSLPLVTLATVVALLAIIAAKGKHERNKEYYFWFSLATFGLFGVFTALDLFTFIVALEVVLFSTFFLIYLFGEGDRQRAAFKFLIYRGLATVVLIAAFLFIIYGAVGAFLPAATQAQAHQLHPNLTFSIAQLAADPSFHIANWLPGRLSESVFLILLLAVFIEEGFVPFHTWLPTAHEHADTATNILLGGVITKTGAYILLRIGVGLLPSEVHRAGLFIAILGVINILYGAFAAWAQKDWRRLIAFGSISHMGLFLLGVAAMNSAGLQGAMFMIVSSGLLSALMFFITGAIHHRTKTTQIPSLGGLSKSMPMLSGFLLVAALGSLGLPLTSGFISEIQAFIGGFGSFPIVSTVGALGIILSAVYLLYAMQKTTFGQMRAEFAGLTDATPLEYVPMVVLTALVLLVGIYPSVIGDLFGLSIHALLRIGG